MNNKLLNGIYRLRVAVYAGKLPQAAARPVEARLLERLRKER